MKSQIWNSKILNVGSWLFLITGLVVGSYLLTSESSSNEGQSQLTQLRQVSAEPTSEYKSGVGHIPIEDIKVGMRVLARNPEISDEERATWIEPNWAEWYHLTLVMPKPDGTELHIEMLRSEEWVRSQIGYAVRYEEPTSSVNSSSVWMGTSSRHLLRPLFQDIASTNSILKANGVDIDYLVVQLDLPELGLAGEARVLTIQPSCQVDSGTGEVVTATFHHSSGNVVDLTIENADGNTESIGTTGNHLFWSVDRQEFVPAGDLRVKEQLTSHANEKLSVVQSASKGSADVYNLEVNNEHVYFVGENGTLVHNAYPVQTGRGIRWYDDVTKRFVSEASLAPRRIAHPNLYPDEAYRAVRRFELKQIDGKWKTVDARGNAFSARGDYNYVVVGDKIYVSNVPAHPGIGQRIPGHIDIARGGDVGYAGEIRFGHGRGNRGQLQWWDNSSGHYRPKASDANTISDLLPIDLFGRR